MNRKFEVTFLIDDEPRTYTRRADGPSHAAERATRQLQRDALEGKVQGTSVRLFAVAEIECDTAEFPPMEGVTVVTLTA